MYELSVECVFSAAHAITIGSVREPLHGHNWRVRVVVAGPKLDADGLLCDFHLVQRRLDQVVGVLDGRNLNDTPPFDRINPTAERVARHIADAMASLLPPGVNLSRVSVTEAPGCQATYRGTDES